MGLLIARRAKKAAIPTNAALFFFIGLVVDVFTKNSLTGHARQCLLVEIILLCFNI